MNIDQKIELLKINIDSYKKHSDYVARGLLIYLAIIGSLFGIITKIEDCFTIVILYSVIILASICIIYFSILIKIWVKKIATIILSFEKPLDCKLDHIYYPAQKISSIILFIGTIILLLTITLLFFEVS